ncbi:MAG: glycosyltransferase family 2 protein [Candidatus Wildermuthbacteria bacterium]|nr:glycosyltransferase family 2 protein [Candidatus Wildermuthbacteria bacterium]
MKIRFIFTFVPPVLNWRDLMYNGKMQNKAGQNSKNPLVSVVIPAFNEEKFVGRAIQSLLEQDFNNFEIIVVDNNSTDRTSEVARSLGAKVFFEPKQGVGHARQRGFSEARGLIIATTDADTIVPKDWLSTIVKAFERDERLVGFGGLCSLYSGPLLARLLARHSLYPFLLMDRLFSGGWNLMGSNSAIKKEAFLKVGGFNEELTMNEDVEISHRLRKVGRVSIDSKFWVKASGRRYSQGLISGLMCYIPTTLMRFFFRKYNTFMRLSPIRTETLPKKESER